MVDRVKDLESQGWSFEAADASFELMVRSETDDLPPSVYELESWRTLVERQPDGTVVSEATVKVLVEGERVISTAEGNGPVNALDNALRKALMAAHPEIETLELVDYKVRILEGVKGTDAVTRVLIRRPTASTTGRPWGCTRTSSRLRGWHWTTRCGTRSCTRPAEPGRGAARAARGRRLG